MRTAENLARFLLAGACALVALAAGVEAHAQVPLQGYFIALDRCEAYQSFRNETNPGDVWTDVRRAYNIVGKNNDVASHYMIVVEEASPTRRWVPVSCGEHVIRAGSVSPTTPTTPTPSGPTQPPVVAALDLVLAASWHSGFCETRPSKPECVEQDASGFDSRNFVLHGLWPQPRNNIFCGVSSADRNNSNDGDWDQLAPLALSSDTRAALAVMMPGSRSFLERHEWIKHGTCYNGASADEYYADSFHLLRALNDSAVQDLFEANVGQEVSVEEIQAAFDASFGAGDRVEIICQRDGARNLITELRIHVRGAIDDETELGDLIQAAQPRAPGCRRGIVDPVGLQ